MISPASSRPWVSALRTKLSRRLKPRTADTIWSWAARNVVLRKPYPSFKEGRFDPDLLPFWREPVEAMTDPGVREIVVWKCSQAGATENLAINPIRYHVACRPTDVIYVGAQAEETEDFFEERIRAGLLCSNLTRTRLDRARVAGTSIRFPDMTLTATWASSVAGMKTRAAGVILADEVSTYGEFSIAKLRKRADTYPFAHIVIMSAADAQAGRPSEQDPIIVEFKATDQRHWYLPDPKSGRPFVFEMGGPKTKHGLKWSASAKRADGSWDEKLVRKTAHYVTPSGTILRSADKQEIVKAGNWVPQAKHERRGYKINCFYMPWLSFGDIAVQFLDHHAKGKGALRVFVLEWLTEEWKEETVRLPDGQLEAREARYPRGQRFCDHEPFSTFYVGKARAVFTTVDVQKFELKYGIREFVEGGDSGLLDIGRKLSFDEIDVVSKASKRVLVDCGYKERAMEVYEACLKFRFVPCKGADQRISMPFLLRNINPFEGTSRQNEERTIGMVIFDSDLFSMQLFDRLLGVGPCAWYIPRGMPRDYTREVVTARMVAGRIITTKPDDFWDVEKMQIVAAQISGFNHRIL